MDIIFTFGFVAIIAGIIASMASGRPQPPQIIYVQVAPVEPSGTGCLPLIILMSVVVLAILFS
ncbi:MAG TPA: hypothetical protein PKD53_03065 [Chloroflexaceae bacterium]|nr:hypothetical protein [Chloroflexaceae bacterium]